MRGALTLTAKLGARHARRHRLRTLLTLTGVSAGVALVFSVQILHATLQTALRGPTDGLGGDAAVVVAAPTSAGLEATIVDELRRTGGVSTVAPILQARTRLSTRGGNDEPVLVLGTTTVDLLDVAGPAPPTITGHFGRDGGGLILSRPLARRLQVEIGSQLQVTTPQGPAAVAVTGLFRGGDVSRVNAGALALMDLTAAQERFGRPDRVDAMIVDGHDADELSRRLAVTLGNRALVGETLEELTGEAYFAPISGLTNLLVLAALVVAGVVVLNTMGMAIAERRRELSLARALGARPTELLRAVVAEAIVLGTLATVVGVVVGWILARVLVARAASSYEAILAGASVGRPVVSATAFVLAFVAGVLVCTAGAAVPAVESFRVAPIEAVRLAGPAAGSRPPRYLDNRRRIGSGLTLIALGSGIALIADSAGPRLELAGLATAVALTGVILLIPVVVAVGLKVVGPALRRCAGTVGRLTADALQTNARRTHRTIGVLVLALTLVIGLAGSLGALVNRSGELARHYSATPIVVEADSTVAYLANQPLDAAVGRRLETVPDVVAVLPSQVGLVGVDGVPAIIYAHSISDAKTKGVLDQLENSRQARSQAAFTRGMLDGEIAVSNRASEQLGLEEGDRVVLPTPSGRERFRIATTYDDVAAIPTFTMDRALYAELWQDQGAQRYGIIPRPGHEQEVLADIRQLVRDHDLPVEVSTQDDFVARAREAVTSQFRIAQAIQWAAALVATLSMAIAYFTAVVQRRWEHALQRAIGMPPRQVGSILLLEATTCALVGWMLAAPVGIGLGWLMAEAVSESVATPLDPVVPVAALVWCLVVAVLASVCAVLYPRWIAVRTTIIDVLRTE